jgi:poly(3-hydroxybutyrate) depolymerase
MYAKKHALWLIVGSAIMALLLISIVSNRITNNNEKQISPIQSREGELEPIRPVKKVIKQTSTPLEIEINGTKRSYVEQKADVLSTTKRLIIALHGNSSSGDLLQKNLAINSKLQDESIIALFPNGNNGGWDDARSGNENTDDSVFITKLIQEYQVKYSISEQNTMIIGISNGGLLAQNLVCGDSKLPAQSGVFIVSQLTIEQAETCKQLPKNTVYILGTKDDIMPYNGGEIQSETGGEVLSAQKTFDRAGKLLECGEKTEEKETLKSIEQSIKDCKQGNTLRLISIIDQGHVSTALKIEVDDYIKDIWRI